MRFEIARQQNASSFLRELPDVKPVPCSAQDDRGFEIVEEIAESEIVL
jgi:hypothetical protein